jgi:solute carrier family 25 (peroxisomal adenine nucleotide transporter), member 17
MVYTPDYHLQGGVLIFFIGIYYFWYEWSKAFLEKQALRSTGKNRPLTATENILAGLIAGSATVILTNPIWVVNTRQTAPKDLDDNNNTKEDRKPSARPNNGFLKILADIIRSEGIGALWSGVIPGLVLVINPIIQYTVFEQLKALVEKRRGSRSTPNDAFLLGAVGKLLATGITYPYSSSPLSDH